MITSINLYITPFAILKQVTSVITCYHADMAAKSALSWTIWAVKSWAVTLEGFTCTIFPTTQLMSVDVVRSLISSWQPWRYNWLLLIANTIAENAFCGILRNSALTWLLAPSAVTVEPSTYSHRPFANSNPLPTAEVSLYNSPPYLDCQHITMPSFASRQYLLAMKIPLSFAAGALI